MSFQLGVGGLLTFTNMLKAVKAGDGKEAKRRGLNSHWATQTPNRAERVTNLFLQ
ncbi:hypothetical protein HKX42_03855 [Salinisphaera sp. USBA-960]|nr:hypothetical protein [Salifodinibacter halophilus]NNC26012.1 hypothetical protein [Salifodinibacter halophilus]